MFRSSNRLKPFISLNVSFLPPAASANGFASDVKGEWGYRQMNQFQEIVGGFGLNSEECDRIASTLVARDFRAMFKRLELNLKYAQEQGMGRQHTKSVLIKNVNVFTGRPNVFGERWKGLASEFDLSKKEMSELIAGFPVVMEVSYTAKIKPLIGLFQEWGVPFSGFREVFLKFPKMLRLSIDGKIIPLQWMFLEAGFRPEEFGAMVVKDPLLLNRPPMEIRTRLKQISTIGLSREEFVSVLVGNPQLIKYSLVKRMEWFEALLGGSDAQSVMRTLVLQDPSVFMGSLNLMSRKVEILKKFGIFKPEQRVLLSANPAILSQSEEDLREKLRLAIVRLGKFPQEVVKCPAYLTAPLEKITSRISFVQHRGLDVGSFALGCWISDGEGRFVEEIGVGLNDFERFLQRSLGGGSKRGKVLKALGRLPIDGG